MRGIIPVASFKALISFVLETETGAVVACCLLCITYMESNMVKSVKYTDLWSLCWLFVVYHRLNYFLTN